MSLSVGIVGLPNAGKSSLFNALLQRQIANVAEYPFTTIEPNTGVIEVPDERLTQLGAALKINKIIPAPVKFIDIAGLVKGAHQGEGLGNKFLSHIRETDAILQVVRDFVDPRVPHVAGQVNPRSDIEVINLELILADFEIVARRLEEKNLDPQEKAVLEKIKAAFDQGKPAFKANLEEQEKAKVSLLNLITLKPMIYVLNINQGNSSSINKENLKTMVGESEILILSAKETGVSLTELIKAAYLALGLITFYTIKGGNEARAWPIKKGATALFAAGTVHTDMAQGFIKAEVIDWQELVSLGSWPNARKSGKIRIEGKDYQVGDGEVLEIKFH